MTPYYQSEYTSPEYQNQNGPQSIYGQSDPNAMNVPGLNTPDFSSGSGINPTVPGYNPNLQIFGGPGGLTNPQPSADPTTSGGASGGSIAQGVSGVAALAGNTYGMAHQKLPLPNFNSEVQYGANGQPSYSGDMVATLSGARAERGASFGEYARGIGEGAGAGAVVGGSLASESGPGAIIGAAAGGIIGAGATLWGGKLRHQLEQQQLNRANATLLNYQSSYNNANKTFMANQAGQQDYYRRMNNYQRMSNLYNLPAQYNS